MIKTKKKLKKHNKSRKKQIGGVINNVETNKHLKFINDFFDNQEKEDNNFVSELDFTKTENNVKNILQNYQDSLKQIQKKSISIFKKIKNKFDVNIIYPKYHGSVKVVNDSTTLPKVPKNTFICFITLLGNLGITSDIDENNIKNYIKNLKKKDMEKILFNLGRIPDIEDYDPKIDLDLYLFMKCMKFSTWYYPEQSYFDVFLTSGQSEYELNNCARYTNNFKDILNDEDLGKFTKIKENIVMNLSEYITKNTMIDDKTINIYILDTCRELFIPENNETVKKMVSKMFEYEYKSYVMNKNIIKDIQKVDDLKRDLPNITPNCCSRSIVNESLLEENNEYRRINLFYNDDFRYTRKNEFMINFYNKIIINVKPDYKDLNTFISLSLKKQIFIINKIIKTTTNPKFTMNALKYIWKTLLEHKKYISIFLENIKVYSKFRKNKGVNLEDNYEDYFYIYNEHVKQYIDFFQANGMNFPNADKLYQQLIKGHNITDYCDTHKKILLENNYNLFLANIKNIIISKKTNDFEIVQLHQNVNDLKKLEQIVFDNSIEKYSHIQDILNNLTNLKFILIKNSTISEALPNFVLNLETKFFNIIADIKLILESNSQYLDLEKCIFNDLAITGNNLNLTVDNTSIYKLNLINIKNLNLLINKSQVNEIDFDNSNNKIGDFVLSDLNKMPICLNIGNINYLHIIKSNIDNLEPDLEIETARLTNMSKFLSNSNLKKVNCKTLILEGDNFPKYTEYPFHNNVNKINITKTPFDINSFRNHFKIPYYSYLLGTVKIINKISL